MIELWLRGPVVAKSIVSSSLSQRQQRCSIDTAVQAFRGSSLEPQQLKQRIETEFLAQWELRMEGVAEEIARTAHKSALNGMGRSSSHLNAIAKVYQDALLSANDLFLTTATDVVNAEAIEPTPRLHQAVSDLFQDVLGSLGNAFNKEIRNRAAAMGVSNYENDCPTIKPTLQAILITASTKLSSVFPKSGGVAPANGNGIDDNEIGRKESEMPKVFISHSSKDAELAGALVDLIRSALNLRSEEIRCTSVEGYKLPGGVDTDDTIRDELLAAPVFVGLISDVSFESAYVLFELGARWGARRRLVPLLAPGVDYSILKGPIGGKSALCCDSAGQLHQFVKEASDHLNVQLEPAAAYNAHIEKLTNWEPRDLPSQGSLGEDQLQQFRSEFAKFLRRLKVELQIERDSNLDWIEDAQTVLHRSLDDLIHFRSSVVSDNEGLLSSVLDSALVEIKALQREDVVMDGGRWAEEFWGRTDALITSLEQIPGILEEQLEEN
jgi:hypothetical protein